MRIHKNRIITAGVKQTQNQLKQPAFLYRDFSEGITLQKIFNKYNWRNMWSGENGTDDGTTLTAIDYAGIDNLSNPALSNKPTLTTLNGKGAVKYDGVDDYLIKNLADWRSQDTEGQLIAVIRTGNDVTNYRPIFATSDTASNNIKVALGVLNGNFHIIVRKDINTANIFYTPPIQPNTIYIVTLNSTGVSYEVTVNGVVQTLTFSMGSNNGMWLDQIVGRDNITAGGIIQLTPFYADVAVGTIGYAPSSEDTYSIIADLNHYYKIF